MNALTSSDFTRADDPFAIFSVWLADAEAKELNDPNAMCLATVDASGLPDARMVLCKEVRPNGLVFYTNIESAKGRELEARPNAAALFHWKSLRRQARFRGAVEMLDEADADAYFASRPRFSRLGAWASAQSRELDSRATLESRVAAYDEQFGEGAIPRPPYWRGYQITPVEIEFWSDGAYRLHDRVRFTREGTGWARMRLYP